MLFFYLVCNMMCNYCDIQASNYNNVATTVESYYNICQSYSSSKTFGHCINKCSCSMLENWLSVKHEVLDRIMVTSNIECLRHELVPVIKMVEFNINSVVILKCFIKKYLWFVEKVEVVATQMSDIELNSQLNCFTYSKKSFTSS